MGVWTTLAYIVGIGGVVIILATGAIILFKMFTGAISLEGLIAETGLPPKASLSRFQFLLFTFIVAGVFLLLCIESGTFVDVPAGVLGLLGISGGSYVVSKGISGGTERAKVAAGLETPPAGDKPADKPKD